jgi:cell division inhibitor SulA
MNTDRVTPTAAAGLQQVLHNPAIWRAQQLADAQRCRNDKGVTTGFAAVDALLPDGGWPLGALSELLVDTSGMGELSLLLPALRQLCRQERGIALLAPPWLPQARVWEADGIPLAKLLLVESSGADLLWSAEQCLRSGECGAVLLWGPAAGRALDHRALQRLQLAAVAGNALCFLFRPCSAAANPSPAPLRLKLTAHDGCLQIHCLKRRGAPLAAALSVPVFPAHWQGSTLQSGALQSSTLQSRTLQSRSSQDRTPDRRPVQLQLCAV